MGPLHEDALPARLPRLAHTCRSMTPFVPSPRLPLCSPAGSFTRIEGAQSCDQCPAGEFSNRTAATECTPCGPGQVCGVVGFRGVAWVASALSRKLQRSPQAPRLWLHARGTAFIAAVCAECYACPTSLLPAALLARSPSAAGWAPQSAAHAQWAPSSQPAQRITSATGAHSAARMQRNQAAAGSQQHTSLLGAPFLHAALMRCRLLLSSSQILAAARLGTRHAWAAPAPRPAPCASPATLRRRPTRPSARPAPPPPLPPSRAPRHASCATRGR